jgi:ribonuclease BN (tRNA processing enzyme)
MQLEVLGIGNAFTAENYNTSFLLQDERRLLIDTPQGLFRLLHQRKIPLESIDGVIVTHVHGDHVSGLETLLLWKRHHEGKRILLYTSQPVYETLQDCFFPSFSKGFDRSLKQIVSGSFDEYVDFIPLGEEASNMISNSTRLSIRHNWHPTPTLGLKLETDFGNIGISGDTCYRPTLLKQLHEEGILADGQYEKLTGDWLWGCDIIYHEADRNGGPHTSETDLLALPPSVQEKIRLIHIPDGFERRTLPIAKEGEKVVAETTLKVLLPHF